MGCYEQRYYDANGDIIGFLNSDDYYFDNTLETVNKYFSKNEIDFLFGSVKNTNYCTGINLG